MQNVKIFDMAPETFIFLMTYTDSMIIKMKFVTFSNAFALVVTSIQSTLTRFRRNAFVIFFTISAACIEQNNE